MKTFLVNITAEYDISEVLNEQETIDTIIIRLKTGHFSGDELNNIEVHFVELIEKE